MPRKPSYCMFTYIHTYIHMILEAQASSSEDKGISEQEGPDIDLE